MEEDTWRAWEEGFREILSNLDDDESLTGLLPGGSSLSRSEETIELAFRAIDLDVTITHDIAEDTVQGSYAAACAAVPEAENILFLYSKMLAARLLFGPVKAREGVIGMDRLPRGRAASEYERFRVRPFLIREMEGSAEDELEDVVDTIGARMLYGSGADWALEAEPVQGIRIRVLYWNSEEGMAPGASIVYGEELLDTGVSAEDMKALTEVFINRLVLCYRKRTGKESRQWESLYG